MKRRPFTAGTDAASVLRRVVANVPTPSGIWQEIYDFRPSEAIVILTRQYPMGSYPQVTPRIRLKLPDWLVQQGDRWIVQVEYEGITGGILEFDLLVR